MRRLGGATFTILNLLVAGIIAVTQIGVLMVIRLIGGAGLLALLIERLTAGWGQRASATHTSAARVWS